MNIPPTIHSSLGTPTPSPIKRARETVTPTKVTGLLPNDLQVDTLTSPVRTHTAFPNGSAPRDTPAKKRKLNAPNAFEEAEKIKYRTNLEKSWASIIDRLLDDDQDKATIKEALDESKAPKKKLHNEKISRKYPSEESLEHTIKLMLFLKNSQGIRLDTWRNGTEKHHFLVRCLQDGTAGYCLTAFQEFFGVASTSATTLVRDNWNNNLNLLIKIPPNETINETCYLAIPFATSNKEVNQFVITPASLIPLKKTTLEKRLTTPEEHPRYTAVIHRKTLKPITRYQDLLSTQALTQD